MRGCTRHAVGPERARQDRDPSDGAVVLQPHKIRRSGVWAAVDGDVLVYVHKEHELDDVERRYPADHYMIVDDKLRILDAGKRRWEAGHDRISPAGPRRHRRRLARRLLPGR
jgi:hypothetical protein